MINKKIKLKTKRLIVTDKYLKIDLNKTISNKLINITNQNKDFFIKIKFAKDKSTVNIFVYENNLTHKIIKIKKWLIW